MTLREELAALARARGFLDVRVASAKPVLFDREVARHRIREGSFSGLAWFDEARVERAADPERLLPGARSLLFLVATYGRDCSRPRDDRLRGRIARYAWGRDYHNVLSRRARPLLAFLAERVPGSRSRFFVDHGPLLERAYAREAGLGWQGKNTMILTRGLGSYTFLAAILTSADLPVDEPVAQSCGTCTRCLPACPTGAIRSAYEVVNDLCISYHTIENRGPIPRALRPLLGDWVFGCDLCQEACPVNDVEVTPDVADFDARGADDAWPDLVEVLSLDEAGFRRRFSGRPVLRARHAGFLRNACVALGNIGNARAVPALVRVVSHPEPLVRGHAAWALGRLRSRNALAERLAVEEDPWVRDEITAALAWQPASGELDRDQRERSVAQTPNPGHALPRGDVA